MLLIFPIFLSFFSFIFNKEISQTVTLYQTQSHLFYPLSYFTCDIGSCSYNLNAKISPYKTPQDIDNPKLKLLIFLDENWGIVNQLSQQMQTQEECQNVWDQKNVELSLRWKFQEPGMLQSYVEGKVRQMVRPHVWYFVLAEPCSEYQNAQTELIKVETKLQIKAPNDSQFSFEESGISIYYYILLIVNTIFCLYAILEIKKRYKKEDKIDYALAGMMLVFFVALISVFFKCIELTLYAVDGREHSILRGIQILAETTVGFLVTAILILLGLGWTILFNSLNQYNLFIPCMTAFVIIQIIIIILTKLFSNSATFQYHDYQGIFGILLACIRLIFYSIFIYYILETYSKVKQKIKAFIIELSIYGSIYFLTYPILLFIVEIFVAEYWRQTVIMIGTFALQEVAIMLLINLFLAKNTQYYKISLQSKSDLPFEKFD